jgi:NADPH-dependent 2,4-dienoyl-CoA reductase/sulfur reductase-like enzyme
MAAAAAAAESGASVLLVERDDRLGGILNQCVHDGFGVELFGESLTGPEYATRLRGRLDGSDVTASLASAVLSIGGDLETRLLSPEGYAIVRPRAIVLAMGCRERPFGALALPSSRPAGIWTAGAAQRLVNVEGVMVGRRAVILGSGDVGLIMARRMVLEGAEVECVAERLPYPGGLPRNVSQCLNDFDIPLLLSHTVVEVLGRGRVAGVVLAAVDEAGEVVAGSERRVECDTLLVSVGLIPENELTRAAGAAMDESSGGAQVDQRLMTTAGGLFACGNALHVHDLADQASLEGARAGASAARFASSSWPAGGGITVRPGDGVRYVVPQRLLPGEPAVLSLRPMEPRRNTKIVVTRDGTSVTERACPYVAPSEMAEIEIGPTAAGPPLEVSLG